MKRRSILLLLVMVLAASALAILCSFPFGSRSNTQIRIGHDVADIPGIASRGTKCGFDPYFIRANSIPATTTQSHLEQAEKR